MGFDSDYNLFHFPGPCLPQQNNFSYLIFIRASLRARLIMLIDQNRQQNELSASFSPLCLTAVSVWRPGNMVHIFNNTWLSKLAWLQVNGCGNVHPILLCFWLTYFFKSFYYFCSLNSANYFFFSSGILYNLTGSLACKLEYNRAMVNVSKIENIHHGLQTFSSAVNITLFVFPIHIFVSCPYSCRSWWH